MNVKQLIELLQQYPSDTLVLVYDGVPVLVPSGTNLPGDKKLIS